MNHYLPFLIPLPDCLHVGKSLKASYANWYLVLRTLRNKATPDVRAQMRKFLSRNDHVRNKDRQDLAAVLRLTNENRTSYPSGLGVVGHTIIPEADKYTEINHVGMYASTISIAVVPTGKILFLTVDQESQTQSLLMTLLHNPVKNIRPSGKGCSLQRQCCLHGRKREGQSCLLSLTSPHFVSFPQLRNHRVIKFALSQTKPSSRFGENFLRTSDVLSPSHFFFLASR